MGLSTCQIYLQLGLPPSGSLNNGPPKKVHVLILGTSECVILCGQRDFVDVIRLGIQELGRESWNIQVAECNTGSLYERKRGYQK